MRRTRCAGCRAEIVWARTHKGKAMPLNADPDPTGNVVLDTSGRGSPLAKVLAGGLLADVEAEGQDRYMPHHATCPVADQYRRAR